MFRHNGKSISFGFPTLDVVLNENDSVELIAIRSASGIDKKEALYRAKHINYNINQKDSLIEFNPQFDIDSDDKWRNQNVKLVLKLPKNKVIFLSSSMKHIIYDIDNVSDTYDKDMLNRRWIMTSKGLECIDCEGLENVVHTIEAPSPPPALEIEIKK